MSTNTELLDIAGISVLVSYSSAINNMYRYRLPLCDIFSPVEAKDFARYNDGFIRFLLELINCIKRTVHQVSATYYNSTSRKDCMAIILLAIVGRSNQFKQPCLSLM